MKIKTSELTGPALVWAVAKCEGYTDFTFWHTGAVTTCQPNGITVSHNYSTDWSQGGPIIDREFISVAAVDVEGPWMAMPIGGKNKEAIFGPAPLIAAMRCFVASKLGDEVDVPEELK